MRGNYGVWLMEFKDLPRHVQDAIRRCDMMTEPVSEAVESLDLTWEITGGNLAELDHTLGQWEGPNWRTIHNDGPASHRYHRFVLRHFHNFLASAVAAVAHAERVIGCLKGLAPGLYKEFDARLTAVNTSESFRLLCCLRDYAIHTGHHTTVLVIRGSETPGRRSKGPCRFRYWSSAGLYQQREKTRTLP